MAVKIRLSRFGRKHRPYWRIVALDSRSKRDGACLENLGSYDPLAGTISQLHLDRLEAWVQKGAQCSPSVAKLVRMYKRGETPVKSKPAKQKAAPAKQSTAADSSAETSTEETN